MMYALAYLAYVIIGIILAELSTRALLRTLKKADQSGPTIVIVYLVFVLAWPVIVAFLVRAAWRHSRADRTPD
jgi:hypothetical protein